MKHLIPEFEVWKKRYPQGFESSLVIPCCRRIQEDRGYIADSDIEELVEYLGVPRIQVEEVIAFYTQFRRQPIGKWHLQLCHNVSCSMRGSEGLLAHFKSALGVQPGQTTADGKFHLSTVECLGSCGTAPMMMVNDSYYENLNVAKVDAMLAEMSNKDAMPTGRSDGVAT
ncbi:MAG: NADH-quinone oxidoreductase subunit NuoE [Gemmatimonadaceae bacterium]